MTDESGQPTTEDLASSQPEGQPEASPEVAAAPEAGPVEQPVEEMVSATEAQKRVSGLQRAYDRRFNLLEQERKRERDELEEARTQLDAAVTRDMTEEQKKQYGFEKRAAELQGRERELQQREAVLQERDALMGWKAYYTEMGVPPEVFAQAETYEDIQDAFFEFGKSRFGQPTPSAAPSGPGPGDKVHTATGASAPGSDFDEYMAEHGMNPFTPEYKKQRKKWLREKKIT